MKDPIGAINKLCKWRGVFATWQLGTLDKNDSKYQAVSDHRELTTLLRAEVNAILELLIQKKVFTEVEFVSQLTAEADRLSKAYEGKFPGFSATEQGMKLSMPQAAQTMKGWRR